MRKEEAGSKAASGFVGFELLARAAGEKRGQVLSRKRLAVVLVDCGVAVEREANGDFVGSRPWTRVVRILCQLEGPTCTGPVDLASSLLNKGAHLPGLILMELILSVVAKLAAQSFGHMT